MPGFNFTPPPGPMQPMNLQQMALQAFRPPPPMSMGGMQGMGMPQQQQGGFGAAHGAGMLSGALAGFKGSGGINGEIADWSKYGQDPASQASLNGIMTGQVLGPNNPSYGDLGGGTGFQPAYAFLNGGGGGP